MNNHSSIHSVLMYALPQKLVYLTQPLVYLSGVLLLNACLTVQAHKANSHKDQGWENFTDAVMKTVSECNKGVVFLLWGSYAQKKASVVNRVNFI